MKIPLVLICGLLSNESLWRHQIAYLSDIASIQVAMPSENNPEEMIQGILNIAPQQFALAGHSMGGWLALELMQRVPDRIVKLCLLNTTARSDSHEKQNRRKDLIARVRAGHFFEIVQETATAFVFHSPVKAEVEKMFLDVGADVFARQEEAMLHRKQVLATLGKISCPTLVIHAAQDKNFSLLEHEELVSKIHKAKLAIVEDIGHMSPLESPQAITALLRFWLTYF